MKPDFTGAGTRQAAALHVNLKFPANPPTAKFSRLSGTSTEV